MATYAMPPELAELSGIALSGPEQLTGAQDEAGRLYTTACAPSAWSAPKTLAPPGTTKTWPAWETLGLLSAIRANDTLFRYAAGREAQRYETGFTAGNNVEDLTYNTLTNTLMLNVVHRAPLTVFHAVYF